MFNPILIRSLPKVVVSVLRMAGEEVRSFGEGRVEALRGFSKHRLSEVSENKIKKLADRLGPSAASLAAEGCDALYNLESLWLDCVFYRGYLR